MTLVSRADCSNGVQFGVMLFLLAAGLTLIFGIMGVINLAHGSLYMIGAYAAAFVAAQTGSFLLAVAGRPRRGRARRHGRSSSSSSAGSTRATISTRCWRPSALILFFNQSVTMLFGRQPLFVAMPPALIGSVELLPGLSYPVYRLAIIAVGLAGRGRPLSADQPARGIGMLVRAGATHRDMVRALGVDIRLLYTIVFGLGALLAGPRRADGRAAARRAGRHGRADPDPDLRRGRDRRRRLDPRRLLRRADRRPRRHAAARLPAGPAAPCHGRLGSRCARRRPRPRWASIC